MHRGETINFDWSRPKNESEKTTEESNEKENGQEDLKKIVHKIRDKNINEGTRHL